MVSKQSDMNFNQKVYQVVKRIPRGKVATYGQVAALVGNPQAARAVGWAMHALDRLPPEQFKSYAWWRVINARGMISTTCQTHTALLQKQLLTQDGLIVFNKNGAWHVDLRKHLWGGVSIYKKGKLLTFSN